RSMRLSSGFSVSHRCSMTRRISRRRLSLARSFTRLKSSRSTSLLWMVRLRSSRFLPPPEEVPPKLGLERRDNPARPLLPWFDRLLSFEIPCCKRDILSLLALRVAVKRYLRLNKLHPRFDSVAWFVEGVASALPLSVWAKAKTLCWARLFG